MGNRHASAPTSSPRHHGNSKLAKQVLRHSPIRLCHICRHGHCKRLVDMLVHDNGDGIPIVVLGTTLPNGKFQISHFLTDCASWSFKGLVVRGHTPNGSAKIKLQLLDRHLLSGTIEYKANEGGGERTLNVHSHLDAAAQLTCSAEPEEKAFKAREWSLDRAKVSDGGEVDQGSPSESDESVENRKSV